MVEESELERLNNYLDTKVAEVISMFEELFKKQQGAITDEEIEEMIATNFDRYIEEWNEKYKIFVDSQYIPIFKEAIKAGAKEIEQKYSIIIDFDDVYFEKWIQSYKRKFTNKLIRELKKSIEAVLKECQAKGMTTKDTARVLHKIIGLDSRQALSNLKFQQQNGKILYIRREPSNNKSNIKNLSSLEDSIEELRYEYEQIKQRSKMIADTGLVTAFNIGLHEIIRKAKEIGLLGKVMKTWITAEDEKLCDKCSALSGVTIDFNEKFFKNGTYTGEMPPAHPNCRCSLFYKEVLPPGLSELKEEQMITPNLSPRLLGKVSNNFEDIKEAVEYYEGQISNQPIENGIIITTEGEVYHTTGDENSLNPILDLGDKLKDSIVTHNHPLDSANEYSFSGDDIDLFMNYNLYELHGLDETFIYELNRNYNDIDKMPSIEESTEFDYRHSQVIDKALELGIGYRRWKRDF